MVCNSRPCFPQIRKARAQKCRQPCQYLMTVPSFSFSIHKSVNAWLHIWVNKFSPSCLSCCFYLMRLGGFIGLNGAFCLGGGASKGPTGA